MIDQVLIYDTTFRTSKALIEEWNSSWEWDPRLPTAMVCFNLTFVSACEFEISLTKSGHGDAVREFARLWVERWCDSPTEKEYVQNSALFHPWVQDTELWKLACISIVMES